MTRKTAALSGFAWGCVGGVALIALMYYAGVFLGLRPLPQLLNEPLLALMPGFVFGFLIDTLQHAGKAVEELGLNDGPATPLIWAAIFEIYAVVLQYGGTGRASVDLGRRRVLTAVPVGIAAVSLGALALRRSPSGTGRSSI